jgi:hypothetical protein
MRIPPNELTATCYCECNYFLTGMLSAYYFLDDYSQQCPYCFVVVAGL